MKDALDRQSYREKGTISAHELGLKKKAEHDKFMKGKRVRIIPHPTIPRTWIEKIVNEDESS